MQQHTDVARAPDRIPVRHSLTPSESSVVPQIERLRLDRSPENEFHVQGRLARTNTHEMFDTLVREESPRIYRTILRLVRDEDEARNLVQETFFQAYRHLDQFEGRSKISTWLFGIAFNVARASLRKQRRLRTILTEHEITWNRFEDFCYQNRSLPFNAWDPELMMEKRNRATTVRTAIDSLPDIYREVVVLRDLEELSTLEAAEALSISCANVRIRLYRGRQELRKLLYPHFGVNAD